MALAEVEDVQTWLGRSLTPAEAARGGALLARAEALVLGYLGCDATPDPVPEVVVWTVAEMVGRVFQSSALAGVQQVSADDGSVMFTTDASSGSVWLSKADKMALRAYRCGGGLMSVQLVGDRYRIEGRP